MRTSTPRNTSKPPHVLNSYASEVEDRIDHKHGTAHLIIFHSSDLGGNLEVGWQLLFYSDPVDYNWKYWFSSSKG